MGLQAKTPSFRSLSSTPNRFGDNVEHKGAQEPQLSGNMDPNTHTITFDVLAQVKSSTIVFTAKNTMALFAPRSKHLFER